MCRRPDSEKGYQIKSYLAVFIDIDCQSLQEHDACSALQLGQERVQDVNMCLGVNLLLDCLVKSNDGVSYCALKCQREMKEGHEGLTMDEIGASFDGYRLFGLGKHSSSESGHLRLLPFILF